MSLSLEAAQRKDPLFSEKAEAVFVRHLAASPNQAAWNEDMVDVAKAHGVVPADDRAFGAVFQSMSRRKVIVCVEYGPRRKGHSGAGARKWRLLHG